jgi:hypothetical protein
MLLLHENYDIARNYIDSKTHDGFFETLLSKYPKTFSVLHLKSNLTWLDSVIAVRNDVLMQQDIEIMFNFAEETQKQRLESKYGNLENAANVLYSHYKGTVTSASELTLLEGSLNSGRRNIDKLDIESLKDNLKNPIEYNDLSYAIKETLDELNEEYKINSNKTKLLNKNIKTLSDAAAKAAILLQRRLKQLERQQSGGNDIEKQAVKSTIQKLLTSIDNNREYSSILDFLEEVSLQFESIPTIFSRISQPNEDSFEALKTSCNSIMEIE